MIPFEVIDTALQASQLAYDPPWGGVTFESDSGAFARISETQQELIVAFRGSDDAQDWAKNVRAYPWRYGKAWVHRGFMCGHRSIWPRVLTEIKRRDSVPAKHLILTGHSYGGALAELSALFLANYPGPVSLVAFGKPNVFFNPGIPRLQYLRDQVSVVSGSDPVARIPALMFGPDPGQAMLYLATTDSMDYWIPDMTPDMRQIIRYDRDLGGAISHHSLYEYRARFERLQQGMREVSRP